MTDAQNSNNTFMVRGRLMRDPYFSDGGNAAMFTISASRSYTNSAGDPVTANDYVEVKVFDSASIEHVKSSGLNKGAIVRVSGRAGAERNSYEKDGETKITARLVAFVETGAGHGVEIERIGERDAA